MRLYLVHHAEALPKEKNPARPLSEKGRGDTERMASFLARGGVKIGRTIESGVRRASETALILGKTIGPGAFSEQAKEGMGADDSPDAMVRAVQAWAGGDAIDTMLVGHMPHLGRLAARLMTGRDDGMAVGFVPGTVACLESGADDGTGPWKLIWMVRPELLGG